MEVWIVSLVIVAIIGIAYTRYTYRPSWEFLRCRDTNKEQWSKRYSPSDLPVVFEALEDIVFSFLLREDDIYRLRPNDRLHDIYKSAYPHGGADSLEFENLASSLMEKGVSEQILEELTNPTVGDIINLCLTNQSTRTDLRGV